MKKRKKDKLRDKEDSTEQFSVQSTELPSVQSNYVYGIGILDVPAIGVCVFFTYSTFHPKNEKPINEKKDQPKRRHML